MKFKKSLKKPMQTSYLNIRVDEKLKTALEECAHQKRLPVSTLIRMWAMEKLQEVNDV